MKNTQSEILFRSFLSRIFSSTMTLLFWKMLQEAALLLKLVTRPCHGKSNALFLTVVSDIGDKNNPSWVTCSCLCFYFVFNAVMFLSVLLFCLFNAVMTDNKLTSVDFEIFGNVQGRSRHTYVKCPCVC